jgi:hypothetical protein
MKRMARRRGGRAPHGAGQREFQGGIEGTDAGVPRSYPDRVAHDLRQ